MTKSIAKSKNVDVRKRKNPDFVKKNPFSVARNQTGNPAIVLILNNGSLTLEYAIFTIGNLQNKSWRLFQKQVKIENV